ncbi:MAG: DUF1501 domain-containing protein [Bacteroidales bacterium]|nr:DUF1501 domain-containing protein [Bacteroidales bacterium]
MSSPLRCSGPHRRELLRFGSVALASAGLSGLRSYAPAAELGDTSANHPAVIFVWLPGGPPHQETFDLKPDAPAEYRGDFRPINTNVPGIRIVEHLPKLATMADKYTLIRSVAHTFSDHGGGHKKFLTGRDPLSPVGFVNDYPMVGSMAAKVLEGRRAGVPNYVAGMDDGRQGIDVFSFGSAYLGTSTHPFTVPGDPSQEKFQVKNLSLAQANVGRFDERLNLLNQLDQPLRGSDPARTAEAMRSLRDRAVKLVSTDTARTAFDVTREPTAIRERYGMHRYGQRALMARRLVEHGASWVTMVMENAGRTDEGYTYNWDSHAVNCHIFQDTQYKLGFLDQAISALIEDLYNRGLNKRVLLVVTGEFGRTPKINYAKDRPGRDHWPQAMAILVAGACRTGQVIGSTTSKAENPKDRPLEPNHLWATVFQHLGITWQGVEFLDGTGRPMPMLPTGEVISELL